MENLLEAWSEFLLGKRGRADVMMYEQELMGNLLSLNYRLVSMTYRHGGYQAFGVSDPKPRRIHKATVEDRVVHRAIHRILYPHYDCRFIYDSYSCRGGKGTHLALERFNEMARRVSLNHTRTVWVLKCDIRKFFASIDQARLKEIMERLIEDSRVHWLLRKVIDSFNSGASDKGLPLGNLTSQLFANIYLNELDYFVKQELREHHYIRYADDFVLLSCDKDYLRRLLPLIRIFLSEQLLLRIHSNKVHIKTIAAGVDFLGWVHFPNHRVLRTSTKRRIIGALTNGVDWQAIASYRALLQHGNATKIMN